MAYFKYQGKMEQEYREMADLIPNATVQMFEHGGHPAIASNAEQVAKSIYNFIYNKCRSTSMDGGAKQ